MVSLDVRELRPDEFREWDAVVEHSAQGLVFHSSDWLLTNASLLNQKMIILGCYEDDELIGGCPLFLFNPYRALTLGSSTTISVPYGGIVVAEIENAKQRKRELHENKVIIPIIEHIQQRKFDYVNLVHSPGLQDIRAFTQRGWNPKVYYTYMLPLDGDILTNTSKDVRQKTRKAQKLGIHSTRQFDPGIFWDLMVRTFAKQGREPPFSERHFRGLLDLIKEKDLGDMWIARTSSGEVAAAEVFLRDQKMFHGWLAASAEEHLSSGAVTFLLNDIFTELKDQNRPLINLMSGNMTQLSSFITGFNPRLVPYYGVEHAGLRYSILKRIKAG
jgi:hypothetical protein